MSNKLTVEQVFEFLSATATMQELGQLRRKMVWHHEDQWHGACDCDDKYGMDYHMEQSDVWSKLNNLSCYLQDGN